MLMSVEFDRGSPGKFDSRTLSRESLSRWTGRTRVDLMDYCASEHSYFWFYLFFLSYSFSI